eukprot:SAG22_NODE_1842_length_3456_cov_3.666369_7_plen_189_part_00
MPYYSPHPLVAERPDVDHLGGQRVWQVLDLDPDLVAHHDVLPCARACKPHRTEATSSKLIFNPAHLYASLPLCRSIPPPPSPPSFLGLRCSGAAAGPLARAARTHMAENLDLLDLIRKVLGRLHLRLRDRGLDDRAPGQLALHQAAIRQNLRGGRHGKDFVEMGSAAQRAYFLYAQLGGLRLPRGGAP